MITKSDLTSGCFVYLQRQHFLMQRVLLEQGAVGCGEGRISSVLTVLHLNETYSVL